MAVLRFTIIDPMHNLFLGTAKSMYKLWMAEGLLEKGDIKKLEECIREFDVGTGLGRLPHKISANYGCYAASQWKNWTLICSLFVLRRASTKGALVVLADICVSLQVSVKACNNSRGTAKSRFHVVTVLPKV